MAGVVIVVLVVPVVILVLCLVRRRRREKYAVQEQSELCMKLDSIWQPIYRNENII